MTLTRLALSDHRLKYSFGGVFAKDMLPKRKNNHQTFIVNTHPSFKEGEHWQAIYFDRKDNCTFFCSYGSKPKDEIKHFIQNNSLNTKWNPYVFQHPETTTCGLFCIYFLWHMVRGFPIKNIKPNNVTKNEIVIQKFARCHLKITERSIHDKTCNQFCQKLNKYQC